ncbi:multidrug ABC transporter permease [Bacillus solimangrovi]|uniref:Multidrug ABC transporter permease n=2 Tax=Bacillus solimangrovi TaxID=1305675 RepID=A0A1E5LFT7_9BACI|nr:ABC transporter permease [Bacillus solimangrovi]OEH92947.1 multidrug ABC transporter permease [Bacillus solimangrovi]
MQIKVGNVITEEWRNIFNDRRLFAVLFIVPLLYTLMFGYLYSNHRVTDLTTVVVDHDESQLSREIIQYFDQSNSLKVTERLFSEEEAKEALADETARVAVIIPEGFTKSIKDGEVLPVLTLIDGSNMLIANSATRAANEVISTVSAGIGAEKLQKQGARMEEVTSTFQTVPFRSRVLYNPTFNYSEFLVYGLIGAVLQQVLLLGIALTVTRDKESGAWHRFIAWRHVPWRIAYAKTVPYFLIGMFNTFSTLLVAIYWFQLPLRSVFWPVILLAVTFTFALLGIGYLSSLLSSNQVGATQITMLIALPSFLLSGFTWPFEAMPKALEVIGHLLPLTYFLDGVRQLYIKGSDFSSVWYDCLMLGLMGLGTFFVAFVISSMQRFWTGKQEKDTSLSA